jgi:hypothetical protein
MINKLHKTHLLSSSRQILFFILPPPFFLCPDSGKPICKNLAAGNTQPGLLSTIFVFAATTS